MSNHPANGFYLIPAGNGSFELWNGYVESEDNLHYSKFCGFQSDGSECWVMSRSDKQDVFIDVSISQAYDLIEYSRPMCAQCNKRPAFIRDGHVYKLCSHCGMQNLLELIRSVPDEEGEAQT